MRIKIVDGGLVNLNLGAPFEAIIEKLISRGYAGNQTEVVRQALLAYDRIIDEDEVILVNKGITSEMNEIKSGKVKLIPLEKVRKKLRG
jgi:Arc/MetJ-type ribon-helix-helix transcriptional regulator